METKFVSEFCVYCGSPTTNGRTIWAKQNPIVVSLCDEHRGLKDHQILEVISDKFITP